MKRASLVHMHRAAGLGALLKCRLYTRRQVAFMNSDNMDTCGWRLKTENRCFYWCTCQMVEEMIVQ